MTGKMEMECRTDRGLGVGVVMVELFAVEGGFFLGFDLFLERGGQVSSSTVTVEGKKDESSGSPSPLYAHTYPEATTVRMSEHWDSAHRRTRVIVLIGGCEFSRCHDWRWCRWQSLPMICVREGCISHCNFQIRVEGVGIQGTRVMGV